MQSVLPRYVSDESMSIHMLLTCPWKPLDVFATVKMLEEQSNPVDQSKCNENSGYKSTFGPGSWPYLMTLSVPSSFRKINSVLELLIKHKSLTESYLTMIIQFAISELQSLDSVSQLLNFGVDQNSL